MEELVAGIKQLIADHPLTNKTNFNVRFNDFGESSLNVLVYFHIETTDYSAELEAREEVLLQIIDLAKQLEIDFAFPTRTLVIENPPETVARPRAAVRAANLMPRPARAGARALSAVARPAASRTLTPLRAACVTNGAIGGAPTRGAGSVLLVATASRSALLLLRDFAFRAAAR